ncbi:MAG TPA: CD225/dispanin family protein [Candidatus Acidoferrales bacterium]|nr:CD225/dispanin family protein [Candidatus Acidoferrales bacterium]
MFCPQCGANNADTAAVCVQCGRSLQAATSPAPIQAQGVILPPGATVPNYLVFAILATVLCCLPAGIPAIVYAAQVNGKLQAGDLAGAQQASKNAKLWCIISVVAFFAGFLVWGLLVMLGILGSFAHH